MRHPHAAHQLGLADIARRDPGDDLLGLLILFQHRGLLTSASPVEATREDRWAIKRI
jgi:hypothetical protein